MTLDLPKGRGRGSSVDWGFPDSWDAGVVELASARQGIFLGELGLEIGTPADRPPTRLLLASWKEIRWSLEGPTKVKLAFPCAPHAAEG